jgi:putative zinc binding protein
MSNQANWRFCSGSLAEFVDFGMSPLCAKAVSQKTRSFDGAVLSSAAYICRDCLLVQLQEHVAQRISLRIRLFLRLFRCLA